MALRAAGELEAVLAALSNVSRLSLVGASMGGIVARLLARRIHLGKVRMNGKVKLEHFVAMGTPNLGVRHAYSAYKSTSGCGSGCLRSATQRLLPTSRDMFVYSETLQESADPEAAAALRSFRTRASYAPLMNDGVVDYESAALGMPHPGEGGCHQWGFITTELTLQSAAAPHAPWLIAGSVEARVREALVDGLAWRIVVVNSRHGSASGLVDISNLETSDIPPGGAQVVQHLLAQVLGEKKWDGPVSPDEQFVLLRRHCGFDDDDEVPMSAPTVQTMGDTKDAMSPPPPGPAFGLKS
eukprot:Hpha_TRINITY_DN5815_c0_g1::TRINITY_DN5815_c0_g1_i1::g.45477::m.45477